MGRLRRRVRWQNFFGTSATCRSWLVGLYCRDFRCLAGNWEKAHGLLKNNPNLAELAEQLVSYGKKLEDAGRIKEAEKLYLTLDKADLAINMYKNFQRYDEVSPRSGYWSLIFFDFVKKRVPIFFSDDVPGEQIPRWFSEHDSRPFGSRVRVAGKLQGGRKPLRPSRRMETRGKNVSIIGHVGGSVQGMCTQSNIRYLLRIKRNSRLHTWSPYAFRKIESHGV